MICQPEDEDDEDDEMHLDIDSMSYEVTPLNISKETIFFFF